MKDSAAKYRAITVVRRALIIQRVIVDGWSSAEAAATFGVSEQLVCIWVADYQRYGMASLRRAPVHALAVDILRLSVGRPFGAAREMANRLRQLFAINGVIPSVPQRRFHEDHRGGE
jgi:hypothetical protein